MLSRLNNSEVLIIILIGCSICLMWMLCVWVLWVCWVSMFFSVLVSGRCLWVWCSCFEVRWVICWFDMLIWWVCWILLFRVCRFDWLMWLVVVRVWMWLSVVVRGLVILVFILFIMLC